MAFVVRETYVTDTDNELVATLRGVTVIAWAMKYAKVYAEDVKVGDELPPLVKGPIQQIQLTRYAGASGDFNPIHQDDEFAKAAGMGGVFGHGMLSMGFVAQVVTDWAGAGTVRKLGVRFQGLVRLKDMITCKGRVLAKSKDHLVELELWAENQKGEKVVTGKATVALASRVVCVKRPGAGPPVWLDATALSGSRPPGLRASADAARRASAGATAWRPIRAGRARSRAAPGGGSAPR